MKGLKVVSLAAMTLSLGLMGCGSDSNTVKKVEDKIKTAVLEGIWQSQTHGFYLDINKDSFSAYDVTSSFCIKNPQIESMSYDFIKQSTHFNRADEIEVDFNNLKIVPIKFDKVDALPAPCSSDKLLAHNGEDFEPLVTFKLFWETYKAHFAFKHFNRFDWENSYVQYENKLNENSSEEEVIAVFDEILAQLRDGHSFLTDNENFEISYDPRNELEQQISAAFVAQNQITDIDEFISVLMANHQQALGTYRDDSFNEQALYSGKIKLTRLKSNIAYLSVSQMYDFAADNGIEDLDLNDDVLAIHEIMDKAIADINETRGLILDLRLNGGGHDHLSLTILSHLMDSKTVIGKKRIKTKDGFTAFHEITVQPAKGEIYTGPIVVLISELTASAAEVFSLGLLARDKVTFVGGNSNGSFSDSLPKTLPNGWSFALSNEQYQDQNGHDYESIGIPVQYQAPLFSLEHLEQGLDLGIDKAIELLTK